MTQAAIDLLRLVMLGIITTGNISESAVQSEVVAALADQVAAGTINAAQYQTYTGTAYSAQ